MYQCPQCRKFTFPLRRVVVVRSAVCPNCNAVVKQRRSWRNALVVLPFIPYIFWRDGNAGLVEGFVAVGVVGLVAMLIAVGLIKLELVK
jgi:hypothetical protein